MYRIELWGYCLIALALALIAPLCLFVPASLRILGPAAGFFSLFGPYLALLAWGAVVAMAARVHGRRALWLMLTLAAFAPFTFLHFTVVIGCFFRGQCL